MYILILLLVHINSWTQVLDKSVAIVSLYKTENISLKIIDRQYELLKKQAESIPGSSISSITKKEVLEAAINDILITQEANKSGISVSAKQIDDLIQRQKEAYGTPISDEDFQTLMTRQTGLQWADYRDQIRKRILQEQYVAIKYQKELQKKQKPSKEEIKKTYDEYATKFINPSMIRSEHLFWDIRGLKASERESMKREAQKTASNIAGNSSVFDAELKKSLENPSIEGGDLGYIIRDEQSKQILGTPFLDALFALNENEVSGFVVSNSGYHVLKVTDKRAAKLLTLDDPIFPGEKITVRQRIIDSLQAQYQQKKFAELIQKEVTELRKKSSIKIIDPQFK